MQLWIVWSQTVAALRPACARRRTYLWLLVVLAAMSVRSDLAGVTSWCAATGSDPAATSPPLLLPLPRPGPPQAHPPLDRPRGPRLRPRLVRVGDRLVLLADGLKAPKEGKKMPAVKSLHQESAGNTKPTFIMGHSCQACPLLVRAVGGYVAVPLACRIHEGLVFANRLAAHPAGQSWSGFLFDLGLKSSFYLIADAYYASRKVALPLLARATTCHPVTVHGHRLLSCRPPAPAGVAVAPSATAGSSSCATCSAPTPDSSPRPAPSMASTASRSVTAAWTCCGDHWGGWSASSSSSTPRAADSSPVHRHHPRSLGDHPTLRLAFTSRSASSKPSIPSAPMPITSGCAT